MQACTPRAVAQVHALRLVVEETLHTLNITGGCRHVDRVVGLGWLDPAAPGASLFEQLHYAFVAPMSGNGEQLFAAVRARIEQDLGRIEPRVPQSREVGGIWTAWDHAPAGGSARQRRHSQRHRSRPTRHSHGSTTVCKDDLIRILPT
jgi:hypothetical protein